MEYTDLDAVECHGASGVGEWTVNDWKEQIGNKEVSLLETVLHLRHEWTDCDEL